MINILLLDSRNIYREKTVKILFNLVHKQKIPEIQEIIANPRNLALINFNHSNSNGETILHIAARTENEEIVKICLKLGADPFMKNRRGKIPIELTRKQTIRDLLKQGKLK